MAIILRTDKGSQLTYAELDGNFTDLDVRVTNATTIAETPVVWNNIQGKPELFDGDYSSLENAPAVPVNIGDLNNVSSNVPSIGQVLEWSGTEWFPATVSDSAFSGSYDDLTDKPVLFSGSYNDLTQQPTIPTDINQLTDIDSLLSSGGGGSYTNSDVDTHLNVSEAQASEVLSWDGANYTWVANAGSGTSYTDSDAISAVTSSDLDMGGNKVLFGNVYSEVGDLPNATNYHGMFAHVHATGAAYFAHGGNWVQLANSSDLGGGDVSDINDLTDVDTSTTPPTANQVLKWNDSESKWLPADDNGPVDYGSRLVWNLADPSASEVLNAGIEADTAWYYGDVVSDPANPTTSVVLDIGAETPTFTGNVMGEVHGDVKTADGGSVILDVDAGGSGTAMYTGDVTGDVTGDITSSGTSTFTGTLEIANLASVGTGNLGFTSAASVNITAADDVNINGTANFDSIFKLTPLSAAPLNPVAGTFAVADYNNWDPASSSTPRPYPVFYDGAVWQPLY